MNSVAVIFAGGSGKRMNTIAKPKQFLELNGKPIIIYTLEIFDNHPEIDGIILVCIADWIPYMHKLIQKFSITKVREIVPGGDTCQDSIYNGLKIVSQYYSDDCVVLIHDGVRPLINEKVIKDNIAHVREYGSCITCIPAIETLVVRQEDNSFLIPPRDSSLIARAPQSFILKDILFVHEKARSEKRHDFIDCCTMMSHYGYKLATIIGPIENIKITTPTDYFIFRAIEEVHENQQIFGF